MWGKSFSKRSSARRLDEYKYALVVKPISYKCVFVFVVVCCVVGVDFFVWWIDQGAVWLTSVGVGS